MGVVTKTKLEYKRIMPVKQSWPFMTRIWRFSKKGILVSRTPDGKGKFWVDLEHYYSQNDLDLADEFGNEHAVELLLRLDSYVNKENEFVIRPSLVEISDLEDGEAIYWTHNQPSWIMKAEVEKVIPTTMPGLFILEAKRLDDDSNKQETYHLRYFSKNNVAPELGRYEIDFDLYTSSRIIQADGEIFTKTESFVVKDETKQNKVYVPYLEANHIYALVSSKPE